MNKLLLTLLAIIMTSCSSLFAKTITVSNNPNSPGQYKRLDSAILAASAGDVLLVSGSTTDYAAGLTVPYITIDRPLIIYGQGYDPRKESALPTFISVLHLTAAASGTVISGLAITNYFTEANTNNITISRCKIAAFGYGVGAYDNAGIVGNNYLLRENVINGAINIRAGYADILIQNNVIFAGINAQTTNTNVVISNNYFNGTQVGTLYNATVINNIFYYKSTSADGNPFFSGLSVVNCVFNNNIYFNTTNANPLSIGINNNSGTGNINMNPEFVTITLTSGGLTRTDNFNLQAGSPGINAGTDGKNVGPEGGSIPMQYPYAGQPAIPQIQSMTITNPVVAPNGTLNVTFTANANN